MLITPSGARRLHYEKMIPLMSNVFTLTSRHIHLNGMPIQSFFHDIFDIALKLTLVVIFLKCRINAWSTIPVWIFAATDITIFVLATRLVELEECELPVSECISSSDGLYIILKKNNGPSRHHHVSGMQQTYKHMRRLIVSPAL